MGVVEAEFYSLLTKALDGVELSDSHSYRWLFNNVYFYNY